ncbi:MAG TPA: HEAT repeat domain-containing protein, partial [Dongiaceae bacterium]|nr:HEAT repeat domain-containing protein [Dongiaceae bacterium]
GYDKSFWASLGPKISEVLPLLTNLLGNAGVAYNAAVILGNIGPDAAPAIPALIQTADVGVAGSFPDAEAARMHLAKVYSSPIAWHTAKVRRDDKGMNANRAMAALALGRIGIATPEVRAALARAWNAPDGRVRHNAADAVLRLGLSVTNDMPELLRGLLDPDNGALESKLAAIGKLGPAARDGLGTLRELAQTNRLRSLVTNLEPKGADSRIEYLAVSAKMAICRIDPQEGRPFLPAIASQIGLGWDPVEFLAEPGPLSNDVMRAVEPLLEQTENTPQFITRQSKAAYVILHHARNHSKALAVLRRNESARELHERLLAGEWLFESLGETNGLCSLIAEGLRAPEPFTGQIAGQIAEQMGDAALPALPAFKAALWHRDPGVREYAGCLILKLAPQELPIQKRAGTN